MLSFATEFPIDRTRKSEDFLRAIHTWVRGSPHTRLSEDNLKALVAPAESQIQGENECIEMLRFNSANEDAAAVKYTKKENHLEWVTNVVFSRAQLDSWVGVRVSCESTHPAARLAPAKKPVIVKTLLRDLGGGVDGLIPVRSSPFRLNNGDISVAARLILGRSGCRLPIVYISAGFHDDYVVDSNRLASDLAGMAHVVVEPNRSFSLRLKIDVNSENVYGGTIGVYWPDGGGRRSFFIGKQFDSPEEIGGAVFEEIRTALTNRRTFERCTWSYVQEAVSRHSIEALKASGSQEINKYVEIFDKEIDAKDQRISSAEREISRLQAEVRKYEARTPLGSTPFLESGSAQDLYPYEVLSIVRSAILDACRVISKDTRRRRVLTAILDANPTDEGVDVMKKRLKNLLRGYKGMDGKVRRGLEEMGFSISEEGKHHKLVFRGDIDHPVILPKSGSDHRGGLNAASDISHLLF